MDAPPSAAAPPTPCVPPTPAVGVAAGPGRVLPGSRTGAEPPLPPSASPEAVPPPVPAAAAAPDPVWRHYFVLVHGNHGHPRDFLPIAQAIEAAFGGTAVTLRSEANTPSTHVGVAAGGKALADEVIAHASTLPTTSGGDSPRPLLYRFTIIGHSLGGLFARSALPHLRAHPRTRPAATAAALAATPAAVGMYWVSYVSLCSPHLGSRRPGGSVAKGLWKFAVHAVVNSLYGQTGEDLMLTPRSRKAEGLPPTSSTAVEEGGHRDGDSDTGLAARAAMATPAPGLPLLLHISHPRSDYVAALRQFQHRTLVAVVEHDMSVPYASAAVACESPHARVAFTYGKTSWRVARAEGFTPQQATALGVAAPGPPRPATEPLTDTSAATSPVREPSVGAHPSSAAGAASAAAGAGGTAGAGAGVGGGSDASVAHRAAVDDVAVDLTLVSDGRREVAYHQSLLDWLQAIPWRRVDLELRVHNPAMKFTAHDFPVAKRQPKSNHAMAMEWIASLVRVLQLDHDMAA